MHFYHTAKYLLQDADLFFLANTLFRQYTRTWTSPLVSTWR